MDILHDKERTALQEENKKLWEENARLREEVSITIEKWNSNQRKLEYRVKTLEQDIDRLLLERERRIVDYQKLLKNCDEQEQHIKIVREKTASITQDIEGLMLRNSHFLCSGQIPTEIPQDDQNQNIDFGSVTAPSAASPFPVLTKTDRSNMPIIRKKEKLAHASPRSAS